MKTKAGKFLELTGLYEMVKDEMYKQSKGDYAKRMIAKWGNNKKFFYSAFNWEQSLMGTEFWIEKNKEYIKMFDAL